MERSENYHFSSRQTISHIFYLFLDIFFLGNYLCLILSLSYLVKKMPKLLSGQTIFHIFCVHFITCTSCGNWLKFSTLPSSPSLTLMWSYLRQKSEIFQHYSLFYWDLGFFSQVFLNEPEQPQIKLHLDLNHQIKQKYMVLDWNQRNQSYSGRTYRKVEKETEQSKKYVDKQVDLMITCYTATVSLTRKYLDNDLLLSTRSIHCPGDMFGRNGLWPVTGNTPEWKRGKMGEKWGKKWKGWIKTGWQEKQGNNAIHRRIFKSTMILPHEAEETDRDKNQYHTDFVNDFLVSPISWHRRPRLQ